MAEITAATVGKLREMTGAGLMDCKKALTENNGDLDLAVDWLRKKGVASAAKKADRAANEGVIAQHIAPGSRTGVLLEVNCETDFVAKNDQFRAFCDDLAKKLAANPGADLEPDRVAAVARIGENIRLEPVSLNHLHSSDELLAFFMGKNTPERQDFIIDNLKVEKDLVETA